MTTYFHHPLAATELIKTIGIMEKFLHLMCMVVLKKKKETMVVALDLEDA